MLVKDYGADIDWNIGSLFAHDNTVLDVLKVCKNTGEDAKIKYAFGSIPCVLQGGRIPPYGQNTESALDIIDKYNNEGIGCRLTFSSPFVTRGDLADETANTLMKKLEENNKTISENKNGIIVESDLLAEYIRYMYPSLELIASQVKPSVEVGLGNDTSIYYNNLLDKYDIVVVNPANIHDNYFLDDLKDKDRVEFIVNHRCVPNCPMAGMHYKTVTRFGQIIASGEDQQDIRAKIAAISEACGRIRAENPLLGASMSEDDIKMLVSKGFHHFKIEGRENHLITFLRDLGDYVFNHEVFERVLHSVAGVGL